MALEKGMLGLIFTISYSTLNVLSVQFDHGIKMEVLASHFPPHEQRIALLLGTAIPSKRIAAL